jgi:hypothetical protein
MSLSEVWFQGRESSFCRCKMGSCVTRRKDEMGKWKELKEFIEVPTY